MINAKICIRTHRNRDGSYALRLLDSSPVCFHELPTVGDQILLRDGTYIVRYRVMPGGDMTEYDIPSLYCEELSDDEEIPG